MSFWYLATPYSKYPDGIEAAFQEAARQAAVLIRAGIPVVSPIAHTHPVAIHSGMDPLDHSVWLPADESLMRAARGLIVCKMDGWRQSYGIGVEIDAFRDMNKPILYMEPGAVPAELSKKRRVIGLCGYVGSGKDAAADGLVPSGWTKFAFSDPVLDAYLALDPIISLGSGMRASEFLSDVGGDLVRFKQHHEVRRGLQRMGTEAGREIHGRDCWVEKMRRRIDACATDVVITGVRFLNEVALIREYDGIVVRVERPDHGPVNRHISELLPFEADEVIINSGSIEDLRHDLRNIAAGLLTAAA